MHVILTKPELLPNIFVYLINRYVKTKSFIFVLIFLQDPLVGGICLFTNNSRTILAFGKVPQKVDSFPLYIL
jgi:hypothetical protein